MIEENQSKALILRDFDNSNEIREPKKLNREQLETTPKNVQPKTISKEGCN